MATMGQRGHVNPSKGRPGGNPLLTQSLVGVAVYRCQGGSAPVTPSKSQRCPEEMAWLGFYTH